MVKKHKLGTGEERSESAAPLLTNCRSTHCRLGTAEQSKFWALLGSWRVWQRESTVGKAGKSSPSSILQELERETELRGPRGMWWEGSALTGTCGRRERNWLVRWLKQMEFGQHSWATVPRRGLVHQNIGIGRVLVFFNQDSKKSCCLS